MSPYDVVSSYLAVSPLPCGGLFFCYGLHKITPICAFHSRILYPVRTFLWWYTSDRSFYLYFNELFLVAEFALEIVILCVYLLDSLYEAWSDVFAMFVALH